MKIITKTHYLIVVLLFVLPGIAHYTVLAQYDSIAAVRAIPDQSKLKFLLSVGETCSPLDVNSGGGVISAKGLNLRAGIYLQDHIRLVAEMSRLDYSFPPISNLIRYGCYELNVQFLGHLPELNTEMYLLAGMGVQQWQGSYIAINDKFGAPDLVERLDEIKGGLNFGLGAEKKFNNWGLFGEFKLRIGEKSTLSTGDLIDALYTFGLKYDFSIKKRIKKPEFEGYLHKSRFTRKESKGKAKASGGSKLPGNKYNLDLIQK